MIEKFYPDMIMDKIQDIDPEMLRHKKIKGLILDIDNTLVPTYVKEADEKAVKWIEEMVSAGFGICIVSNSSQKRVEKFNEKLDVYAIHRAFKPNRKALMKATGLMGIKPDETAIVGDQLFTDIYGGNKLDMLTILVQPIDKNEFFFVKFKRIFEKLVFMSYKSGPPLV